MVKYKKKLGKLTYVFPHPEVVRTSSSGVSVSAGGSAIGEIVSLHSKGGSTFKFISRIKATIN